MNKFNTCQKLTTKVARSMPGLFEEGSSACKNVKERARFGASTMRLHVCPRTNFVHGIFDAYNSQP